MIVIKRYSPLSLSFVKNNMYHASNFVYTSLCSSYLSLRMKSISISVSKQSPRIKFMIMSSNRE